MDKEKRIKFVKTFFGILKMAEIDDLMEIREAKFKNFVRIFRETKNIDPFDKELLKVCFKDLYAEWRS